MSEENYLNYISCEIEMEYYKTPQRAKRYADDVIALYHWMKGKHASIAAIAEGMGWSSQKARAVVKIARKFEVIKRYSRNTDEFQLTRRLDLTQEFKAYRWALFRSGNLWHKNTQYTDIEDLLKGDYSEENQKRVMKRAYHSLWRESGYSGEWTEIFDAKLDIERDINGNIAGPDTPKKLLKRGSRYL